MSDEEHEQDRRLKDVAHGLSLLSRYHPAQAEAIIEAIVACRSVDEIGRLLLYSPQDSDRPKG